MLKQGDSAPDLRLRDSSGAEVALADLWRERPLALVFLRHFG
jgi:peroxiredoxin